MRDQSSKLSWIRKDRVISGALDLDLNFKTTVYLGIYNGDKYIVDRIKELENQTSQDFFLIVSDNCSPEFKLDFVENQIQSSNLFANRYLIIQNPVNLGAIGSFQLNLDLVPSPWITFFHQDDKYLPNHVAIHLNAITQADDSKGSFSTDLGSRDLEGKVIPAPPRANWFIKQTSKHSTFLANVAEQVVLFPALSIRTKNLVTDRVPPHSVAFADSEHTLFALMMGEHEFIPKETAFYSENPFSESHILGTATITLAATLGLLRVFTSQEFVEYVCKISSDERAEFVEKLEQSIKKRIPNVEFAELVWTVSLEQLNCAWGYEEPYSTAATRDIFSLLGESYTPDILNGILSKLGAPAEYNSKGINPLSPSASFASESGVLDSSKKQKKRKLTVIFALYQVVGRLPYFIRKRIFKIYNFLKSMPDRHSRGNF
jgi:glycosyltransferase involved in cell wall biosynthesis